MKAFTARRRGKIHFTFYTYSLSLMQEALNLIHRFTNQSILCAELFPPSSNVVAIGHKRCMITVVKVIVHQKILFYQNNLIKYKHFFIEVVNDAKVACSSLG